MKRTTVIAVASGLMTLVAVPEAAVLAQERGLEEVVVTARKREESLLTVPISINAFTAEEITRSGAYDIKDVAAMSTSLTFQTNQSTSSFQGRMSGGIAFRGAQLGAGVSSRDNTGSVFIDGVFIDSGLASISTSDVERIEVLKGPQNTYFGRNTFSGAINFVTRNPGNTFKGKLESSATDRGSYDVITSVEGPLAADKLAGRLVVNLHRKAAMYTATDGGELGMEGTKALVGTLYATPTDNWWARLRVNYQNDEDGPSKSTFLRGTRYGSFCTGQTFRGSDAAGNPVQFALSRPYFCGKIPTISDLGEGIVSSNTTLTPSTLVTIGQPNLFRNMLVNNSFNNPLVARAPSLDHMGLARNILRTVGQTEYTLRNGISLAFNLSHEESDAIAANDPDRADVENTNAFVAQITSASSFEVRLVSPQDQKLRWVIGGSYFRNSQENQQLAYQIGAAGGPLPTNGISNPLTIDKGRVPALFAAVEYDLGPQFTVSLESRYQKDKSTIAGATTSFDAESKDTLPRAIVQFKPNETTNVYVSYAEAVMPGNPNTSLIVATPSQKADILALFPDATEVAPIPKMTSYEAGVKQRLFNDRLQYSLSAYVMDWDNINSNVAVPVSTTPFFLSVVRSNDAELKGIEFEAEALLTDHWSSRLALTVQRNRLTRFFNSITASLTSGVSNFVGNRPGRVPERNASFSTTYSKKLSGDFDWFARADVNYTGKQYESEANIGYIDAFTRVNARIGIEKPGMRLELYARNLFDDKNWENGFRSTSLAEPGALLFVPFGNPPVFTTVQGVSVGAPDKREIGIKATFEF